MGIDWTALQANFPAEDLEWRLQQAGKSQGGKVWALCVPYLTNRAIMQRLDDVVGPENWKNEFRPGPGGGVVCGISIRVGDDWVTKWDGAENTDIEGVKGGLSNAMKRAAVQWGLGRILYQIDDSFAIISDNGKLRGKTKDGDSFKWSPPELPAWALPPRRTAKEREHDAILAFIRAQFSKCPDDLKERIRAEGDAAKEKYAVASTLCGLVEKATGEKFQPSPVA